MFRLKRGWKYLAKDPHLQKEFGIEQEFSERIATATFGSWILQKKIPNLVETVTNMSIDEIIELREQSNHSAALKKYRDGISNLVMSHDLWEAKTFREFENEAYKIFIKQVLPAFEELEKQRILSLKDVLVALDWKNALKETIKSAPASSAHSKNLLSSGSSFTTFTFVRGCIIIANNDTLLTVSSISSSVRENLSLASVLRNSSSISGEVTITTSFSSTLSINLLSFPFQKVAEIRMFVSGTKIFIIL